MLLCHNSNITWNGKIHAYRYCLWICTTQNAFFMNTCTFGFASGSLQNNKHSSSTSQETSTLCYYYKGSNNSRCFFQTPGFSWMVHTSLTAFYSYTFLKQAVIGVTGFLKAHEKQVRVKSKTPNLLVHYLTVDTL